MRLGVLESPFAHEGQIPRNVAYAKFCVLDCLKRGEAPIASHLLYAHPEVLDDKEPLQRALGMIAGRAWYRVANAIVLYTDFGISDGMQKAIDLAHNMHPGIALEMRTLDKAIVERLRMQYEIPAKRAGKRRR